MIRRLAWLLAAATAGSRAARRARPSRSHDKPSTPATQNICALWRAPRRGGAWPRPTTKNASRPRPAPAIQTKSHARRTSPPHQKRPCRGACGPSTRVRSSRPTKSRRSVDWRGLAGEPLDAVNNGVLREASAVWRPAHPESIRVMHLSAYELGVVARHSYAEATHCGAWTRSSNGSLEICAVRRRGGGRATTVRLRSSPSSAACGSTAWRRGRSRREP